MKSHPKSRIVAVACLSAALAAPLVLWAQDASEQVRALKKEFDTAYKAFVTEAQATKNPTPEQRAAIMAKSPQPKFGAQFLALGEKLGKDPAAAEAFVYVVQFNPRSADATKAMDLLARDHVNSPRVLPLIAMLPRLESEPASRLLKALAEKSTEASIQSAAKKAAETAAKGADFAIGKVAPEISGEDIDGKAFKLSDYRGKVVVIDFWGDW